MKVTKIIDPEFKTGTTTSKKTGKPVKWSLIKIQTEDGTEATGFGPVMAGDNVDLTFNQQYDNYSFKVLEPNEIPSKDVNEDLKDEQPKPKFVGGQPTDLRGDAITASMAVKLAYVEFVRCESQLPQDTQQWEVIEDNARNLMDMVGRVKVPPKATLKAKLAKGFTKDEEDV